MKFLADLAENSIMQTISIAVSAILIAGGVVTAPSLINNARDVTAKVDLLSIANAQERSLGANWQYQSQLANLPDAKTKNDVGLIANGDPDCYSVFIDSPSGKSFYRTSKTSVTSVVQLPWPVTPPADYPFPCVAWPITEDSATKNISPPLSSWVLSGNATYDDKTESVTLARFGSTVTSPLIKIDGPAGFSFAADAIMPVSVDAQHNNLHMGIAYFASDGVTGVANSGGWTANGDAKVMSVFNTWKRMTSSLGPVTGSTAPTAAMTYIKITITASTGWSQPGVQVRTPTVTVVPR